MVYVQVHYHENPVPNTSQNNNTASDNEERVEHTDSSMFNLEDSFNAFGVEHDKALPLPKLTLIELLRHFATYTNQTHDAMTYLLFLLKVNKATSALKNTIINQIFFLNLS